MHGYHISYWAARIFPLIPDPNTPGWISVRALAQQVGISGSHVRKAVGYLKDTYPQYALVSSREGYRLSTTRDEVEGCVERLGGALQTGTRRLYTGVALPATNGRARKRQAVQKAYSAAVGDLAVAIQRPLF